MQPSLCHLLGTLPTWKERCEMWKGQEHPEFCLNKITGRRSRDLLYSALVRLYLGYCIPSPQDREDLEKLEQVHKRGTRMITGWSTCPGKKGWGTEACSGWRMDGFEGTQQLPPMPRGRSLRDRARPFTVAHNGMMANKGQKLKQERFRLDTRKNFFPVRTVRQWNSFRPEQSPALKSFKTRLDQALSDLVWSHGWPCSEKEVGLEASSSLANSTALWFYENSCLPHK